MQSILDKLDRPLAAASRIADYLAGALLVLLTVTVFTEVVFRYLLGMPIRFSGELAMIIFPWMIFLSAVMITWSDSHIGIVVFRYSQTGLRRKITEITIYLIMIAFSVIMIYAGWNLAWGLRNNILAITRISRMVLYIPIPLAFTLFSLILSARLFKVLRQDFDEETGLPDKLATGETPITGPENETSDHSASKSGGEDR